MFGLLSRRDLLHMASMGLPAAALGLPRLGNLPGWLGSGEAANPSESARAESARAGDANRGANRASERVMVSDSFPAHAPELVREMVTVAHFDLARVKELVGARPALARAAWDWGFGDWETPLGAASHMGNRRIAEYLLEQGAPPSLFSAAMLGQLEVVKALVGAQAGVQRIRGPHSISLLAHARMGGEGARAVFDFLQSLGDADAAAPVALSDAETAALVGTYVFGVGVSQQVDVSADLKMYANNKMYTHAPQLHWTRKGTMTRPLFHLGNRTFYPAGAPFVRVAFAESAGGMVMSVNDGELVVSAARKPG